MGFRVSQFYNVGLKEEEKEKGKDNRPREEQLSV
jgi:hypothetical protein